MTAMSKSYIPFKYEKIVIEIDITLFVFYNAPISLLIETWSNGLC